MLGKLLKYDFRSMWKQFSVIWPAALILAFLNRFTMFGMDNPGGSAFGEWMGVISMGLFGGVCFTMVILSAVFVLTRFYKGLLGDEGYLMHTLPVPVLAAGAIQADLRPGHHGGQRHRGHPSHVPDDASGLGRDLRVGIKYKSPANPDKSRVCGAFSVSVALLWH